MGPQARGHLDALPEPAWSNSTAVSWPLAEVVRSLQKGSDADLGVHGSIGLSQSLLAADLVDESAGGSLLTRGTAARRIPEDRQK